MHPKGTHSREISQIQEAVHDKPQTPPQARHKHAGNVVGVPIPVSSAQRKMQHATTAKK